MAKNFLDQDESKDGLGYTEGFRFGFGFFVANLLGLTMLGILAAIVNLVVHRLH